jgi:hypothetical protein
MRCVENSHLKASLADLSKHDLHGIYCPALIEAFCRSIAYSRLSLCTGSSKSIVDNLDKDLYAIRYNPISYICCCSKRIAFRVLTLPIYSAISPTCFQSTALQQVSRTSAGSK